VAGGKRRMMEGLNSAMIYYKNFYKCHNAPPVQYNNKKEKRYITPV
jgi:hypothetical protein